ncbi:hypothetical protein ACE6H2_016412 [Prunus campanulata]
MKTRGLFHVDLLLQVPIQEGITNIQLLKRPIVGKCQRQYSANGSRFDHRAKGFYIIKTFLLIESLGKKTSLVSVN